MYAKVFQQIYDGTLCTDGPWQALVTFQQMLVLADIEGNVDMTAEAIARRTTIPVEIIRTGIAALLLPDPQSRTPDEEGRRILPLIPGRTWGWRVTNYVQYRALQREEDRRAYHREYWRSKRSPKAQAEAEELNSSTKTQQPQPNQPIEEAYTEAEAKAEAKTKDKARKRAAPSGALRPESVSQQVWDDWTALRKSKRAPITVTVLEGAQGEAAKAGMSLEDFLRVWCSRGSQGLEAAWLKPQERTNGHSAEPAWKTEQRSRMAEFAGPAASRSSPPTETIDVDATRLD